MRPVITSIERGPARPPRTDVHESSFEEAVPAPVSVDRSGPRGRLPRGFGLPVPVVQATPAVATADSPIVVQAATRRWKHPRSRPPSRPHP